MKVINNPITLYFPGLISRMGDVDWDVHQGKTPQFPPGCNKIWGYNIIISAINLLSKRYPALAKGNLLNGAVED